MSDQQTTASLFGALPVQQVPLTDAETWWLMRQPDWPRRAEVPEAHEATVRALERRGYAQHTRWRPDPISPRTVMEAGLTAEGRAAALAMEGADA